MKKFLELLIFINYVFAWWDVGHMMTAKVAELKLKKEHPEVLLWAESLVEDLNSLTDGRSNTFVESSSWPDDIKEEGIDFMDLWHYMPKPVNENGILIQ